MAGRGLVPELLQQPEATEVAAVAGRQIFPQLEVQELHLAPVVFQQVIMQETQEHLELLDLWLVALPEMLV